MSGANQYVEQRLLGCLPENLLIRLKATGGR